MRLPSNQKYDFNIVCACVRGCVCARSGRWADGRCARCHSVTGEQVSRAGCSCCLRDGPSLPLRGVTAVTAMRASHSTPPVLTQDDRGRVTKSPWSGGSLCTPRTSARGADRRRCRRQLDSQSIPQRLGVRERVPWLDPCSPAHGPPKARPLSPSARGTKKQAGTRTSGRLPGLEAWLSHSQACKRAGYAAALRLSLLAFKGEGHRV